MTKNKRIEELKQLDLGMSDFSRNFSPEFRPDAEALLLKDVRDSALRPLELSKAATALASMDQAGVENLIQEIGKLFTEGAITYGMTTRSETVWWSYELQLYKQPKGEPNAKLVCVVASDHLAYIAFSLAVWEGIPITDEVDIIPEPYRP